MCNCAYNCGPWTSRGRSGRLLMIQASSRALSDLDRGLTDPGGDDSPDDGTNNPDAAFYGLTEKPFSLSTDPVFLYHSTAHDRTAQALLTSIGTRPGVVVITGPYGIGKTSLCRAVIEQLDRRRLTSFLVDPFLTVDDLLQTLLIDFGALSRDDLAGGRQPSTDQLRDTLHSFLASLASFSASAVVLVDDAQNLPVSVLDELRALSEIREGRRLLQVVLLGDSPCRFACRPCPFPRCRGPGPPTTTVPRHPPLTAKC
jgi:AAA domain